MDIGNLITAILAVLASAIGAVGAAILWGKHVAETAKARAETNGVRAETTQTWQEIASTASQRVEELERDKAALREQLRQALDGEGGA